ncbi:MAG: hypothetical protein IJ524_04575 [Bacteroidales bacterium]|nr:hypothetical protein [Bacteroidales bacterium]
MENSTYIPQSQQMIVTLEDNVAVSEIRKVLLHIRGIASVQLDERPRVTPALRTKIRKAREESAQGETVVCSTPEEMQQYFDTFPY